MRRALSACLILLLTLPTFAARVEQLSVHSEAMDKAIPLTVVTPDNYSADAAPYRVVYLLHGHGGDHQSWVRAMPVTASLADRHNVIIVCPDGGVSSWYWDSPADPAWKYETHVIDEVIPFIDDRYHTLAERAGRAITGFSMGGHGGLWLSFRHQDLFCAAGSMSGGVDIRPFPDQWNMAERLGPLAQHPERWDAYTVINQVHLLRPRGGLALIIDCGTSDFFYEVNQQLHTKLLARRIPHDYIERPGRHDAAYWNKAVETQFLFFAHAFAASN